MTRKAKRRRGLPRGATRVRIEVKPNGEGGWEVTESPRLEDVRSLFLGVGKREALVCAVAAGRDIAGHGGFASVRVHDRKGKFQFERTYPRSSDPCPPKG